MPCSGPTEACTAPAAVLDVDVGDAEHGRIGEVHGHGVRHHRDIDVGERALVHHDHLAAVHLLGRRAEDDDARVGRVDRLDERDGRPDACRRDQVVPAGVADVRERVVLGADGDGDGAVPPLAAERRLHAVDAGLDIEPLRLDERDELADGVVLLEREFGMRMDLTRDADELVGNVVDRAAGAVLRGIDAGAGRRHAVPPVLCGHRTPGCGESVGGGMAVASVPALGRNPDSQASAVDAPCEVSITTVTT